MKPITNFRGGHFFLSNMYPCKISHMKYIFPSVENAYQAMKTDEPLNWKPFEKYSPKESKMMGRELKLRTNWENEKIGFMIIFIDRKFNNPILQKKLLDTGDVEIIEGNNWHDTFWGQCPIGNGKNHLGKILMNKRESLRLDW